MVFYHGSSAEPFDRFSLAHALEGDGKTWSSPNIMGRLLMELRDKGALNYTLPEDSTRFSDLLQ